MTFSHAIAHLSFFKQATTLFKNSIERLKAQFFNEQRLFDGSSDSCPLFLWRTLADVAVLEGNSSAAGLIVLELIIFTVFGVIGG